MKQHTEAEVLTALRKMTSHGIRVVHEPQQPGASTIDPKGLETPYEKQQAHVIDEAQETAKACAKFLSLPVIADSFDTHKARLEWANSMVEQFGRVFTTFYMRNGLRLNVINDARMELTTLANAMRVYKVESKKADAIRALVEQLPDISQYDRLSNEERLEVVEALREICRQFLSLVAPQAGTEGETANPKSPPIGSIEGPKGSFS